MTKQEFKTNLIEQEFRAVKDLVCSATLERNSEKKQYYLLEIGGIMVGSKKEFMDSAKEQGYNISEGIEP